MKNSRRYKTRIAVIVDNESNSGLLSDWGLSIYVESTSWRALFDAGSSPSILRHNAKKLGIDLHSIDFAVLSHYHYDHLGGFKYISALKPGLTVYVPPGPARDIDSFLNPIVIRKTTQIADNAYIVGPLHAWLSFYEIAFAIQVEDRGLVILVGCSHPGIVKIVSKAVKEIGRPAYMVLGGFHAPPVKALDNLAKISGYIGPSHCSGAEAKKYVLTRYPDKFLEVKAGTIIKI